MPQKLPNVAWITQRKHSMWLADGCHGEPTLCMLAQQLLDSFLPGRNFLPRLNQMRKEDTFLSG